VELGRIGIWWGGTWRADGDGEPSAAPEVEELGYSTLWSSGRFDPGISPHFEQLLAATKQARVASGVVSIWHSTPEQTAQGVTELEERYPGRFVLGLGASHGPLVPDYHRPYSKMVGYLDSLDALGGVVSRDRRMLAALGPKMLRLAAERAAGAHPYFVPVEHTERARKILGQGPLLAPEVTVLLEHDPERARARARSFTSGYLGLPNYANNIRTLGFDEDDVRDGGSDRLVDSVIGWGTVEQVAAHVRRHLDAGADHVCIQVLADANGGFPLTQYRELAAALL
jgi:probable F420-dependent oxidoreductase